MAPLTRTEAEARAELLDVHRYEIDLDLTRGDRTFASTTTIRFTARRPGDTFAELRPTTLHRATLDGLDLDPHTLTDGRLPLPALTAGAHELTVTADMPYSRTGEGLHRFTDPADGLTYLYSMCFLADAPLVFAAFDQPDLKAVFDLAVTAPEDWTVLGNGIATPVTGQPGRHRCATTPPISTYLVAVAAGPYHSVRTEHAGLTFGLHVRRSLAEHLDKDADELLDITRRCFDHYHELFDEPYPFDSYDQAFVPEFNAGAMENPGLVTISENHIHRAAATDSQRADRAVTIAHEMAHMWFGDLVTLRWWDDIWLNESFADYLGYRVTNDATDHRPWPEFSTGRKQFGYDADQRASTHPVAPEPDAVPDTAAALLNFDGISYAKGASALRQLVTWLGDDAFLTGLNDHFARHRFGNATLADLVDAMTRASGRPVTDWADAWLRTTGPDTLTAGITTTEDAWHLRLAHAGARPHRLRLGTYTAEGTPLDRHDLDLPAAAGTTDHTYPGPRPDLVVLNDGDLTYAKIRLDPHSWNTARRTLSALPDPLTRTVLWTAARDMVRDGDLPPEDYLDTARGHLPAEPVTAILEAALAFATGPLAGRYLPHHRRPAALATLSDLAHELLAAGDTDPARRLVAARTAIDTATEPAPLRAWRQAGTLPGGPALDPELRWRLLRRLAALGATTEDEIDAEAARDTTAAGAEGAARCRAALPDPAAKEAAWEAMFGTADTLSNYLFRATAEGFWQHEQRELLTPWAARYFPAAVDLAARRGHTLGALAGRAAFPHTLTDPETLRLGEETLRRDDLTPALRRGLGDQLDELRRALAVLGR
ncbi:aminopeptidase N [Streptomyces marincola]|uniref:aminopeptidase N n=1 Tax=Streptomyces marincola TaxID=2878388 RepID=UPI001CF36FD6|nr:aminopeptidase N [Streptomyces marincola]UCM87309.1 aminopeptidase N [Streptomyces marincola]